MNLQISFMLFVLLVRLFPGSKLFPYTTLFRSLAVIDGDKQNTSVMNAQAVYNNALSEVSRFESAYTTGGVTKQQLDQVKLQLEKIGRASCRETVKISEGALAETRAIQRTRLLS